MGGLDESGKDVGRGCCGGNGVQRMRKDICNYELCWIFINVIPQRRKMNCSLSQHSLTEPSLRAATITKSQIIPFLSKYLHT